MDQLKLILIFTGSLDMTVEEGDSSYPYKEETSVKKGVKRAASGAAEGRPPAKKHALIAESEFPRTSKTLKLHFKF